MSDNTDLGKMLVDELNGGMSQEDAMHLLGVMKEELLERLKDPAPIGDAETAKTDTAKIEFNGAA